MNWVQDELEFQDDVVEKAEGLRRYERGIDNYNKFLSMYWNDKEMEEHLEACKIRDFLNERLPLDYEPFEGKVKWEPTGLINMHGRWRYRTFIQMCKDIRNPKKKFPIDVSMYSFEMIEYGYKMGDFSGEEYLENVRRKVAFENEGE